MILDVITPKKFLCRWELRTGAKIIGICMCLLMAACTVAGIVQILKMTKCVQCDEYSWKNAYTRSLSVTFVVYCVAMLGINIWFLWGIIKEKATVVLSWVVITAAWMVQSLCFLIVLLCIYSTETNFIVWVVCLVFSFKTFCLFSYGLLVGYGYWLQLKQKPNTNTVAIN